MNETDRVPSYSPIPDCDITCVPAFTTCFNQQSINEKEKSSPGTDPGGNGQWKKEKTFPWLASFLKQCCGAVGNKSVTQLENLLKLYIQHVTPHFNECQKLPNKAAKLKRNINETMVFLHLLYSDLHEPLDNSFYHEMMSDIMAMFLDLEITASRRGKDTIKEISNRLSSTLYTFLDHSDDHILDAILKTQLINKHSKNLCAPFLRKVLTELVVCRPLSALTYVRYVLAFKMWKNVVADATQKKAINKIALQRLLPPPKFFQNHDVAKPSCEVLPKVPKNKKNFTQFYIQTKFNVKDACRAFFRFCKENNYQDEPMYITQFSMKSEEEENSGCLSLINDIWSSISKDASDNMPLLEKSEVFSEDRIFCDDSSLSDTVTDAVTDIVTDAVTDVVTDTCETQQMMKDKMKVESPDSGVCLGEQDKAKRKPKSKDGESYKVPDSTFPMYPDSQEVKSCGDESTDAEGSVIEIVVSETSSPEPTSTVSASNDSVALSRQDDQAEEAAVSSRLSDTTASLKLAVPPADAATPSNLPDFLSAASSSVTRLPNAVFASHELQFEESNDDSVIEIEVVGETEIKTEVKTEAVPEPEVVEVEAEAGAETGVGAMELPSSSRLDSTDGAQYAISPERELVVLPPLRRAEVYDDVVAELSEDEWRRYCEYIAQGSPGGQDEIWRALENIEGSRACRSSSNCHLPLKKRKLAASSSRSASPPVESNLGFQHSVPLNDLVLNQDHSNYHYPENVFTTPVNDVNRHFILKTGDTYKIVRRNPSLESRKRSLESEPNRAGAGFLHQTTPREVLNPVDYAFAKSQWPAGSSVHPQRKSPCAAADGSSASVNSLKANSKRDLYSVPNFNSSSVLQNVVSKREVAHCSSNVSEEPDNLKILAEEAVRIWEAEQGVNVQPTFGMYASPSQTPVKKEKIVVVPVAVPTTVPEKMRSDYLLSYPSTPMLSIAALSNQNKCVEDSVIVRNDQYYRRQADVKAGVHAAEMKMQYKVQTPGPEPRRRSVEQERLNGNPLQAASRKDTAKMAHQTKTATQRPASSNNAPMNGCDLREQKPLDMSAGRRKDNLPYSQSVGDKANNSCPHCKSTVCKEKCRFSEYPAKSVQGTVSRQQVTPSKTKCNNCRSEGCKSTVCKEKSRFPGYSTNSVQGTASKQVTFASTKCNNCRSEGCKSAVCKEKCRFPEYPTNSVQGTVSKQVTSSKTKCNNCRSEGCKGKKCKAVPHASELSVHHSEALRRALANTETPKKQKKCATCKNGNCAGKCNSSPANSNKMLGCEHCKLAHCQGSCISESNRQAAAFANAQRSNAENKVDCQYCRKQGCDSLQCMKKLMAESKRCDVCKSSSCKGKCKASPNRKTSAPVVHTNASPVKTPKCSYCKSVCMGTCRLAQKKQMLEKMKCDQCNTATCKGKCNVAKASCSYCSQKNCSGSCRIHHSVDSILSSSRKVESSPMARLAPESTPARSNKRRTRNSKAVAMAKLENLVPEEKATPTEAKRRKKSVSR